MSPLPPSQPLLQRPFWKDPPRRAELWQGLLRSPRRACALTTKSFTRHRPERTPWGPGQEVPKSAAGPPGSQHRTRHVDSDPPNTTSRSGLGRGVVPNTHGAQFQLRGTLSPREAARATCMHGSRFPVYLTDVIREVDLQGLDQQPLFHQLLVQRLDGSEKGADRQWRLGQPPRLQGAVSSPGSKGLCTQATEWAAGAFLQLGDKLGFSGIMLPRIRVSS